jgi:hypothetical protein
MAAEHLRAQDAVGFRLVSGPLLLEPFDDIGIQPQGYRPLDGPVHATTHGSAQLLLSEFRDVRGINSFVWQYRKRLEFLLAIAAKSASPFLICLVHTRAVALRAEMMRNTSSPCSSA